MEKRVSEVDRPFGTKICKHKKVGCVRRWPERWWFFGIGTEGYILCQILWLLGGWPLRKKWRCRGKKLNKGAWEKLKRGKGKRRKPGWNTLTMEISWIEISDANTNQWITKKLQNYKKKCCKYDHICTVRMLRRACCQAPGCPPNVSPILICYIWPSSVDTSFIYLLLQKWITWSINPNLCFLTVRLL